MKSIVATRAIFGMAGIGISVWALTIPLAKARFHLDDSLLGLLLFASGIGGVVCMPVSGFLLLRLGGRRVLVFTGLGVALLLPVLAWVPSLPWFTVLVMRYGAMFGVMDVAMNAKAGVVQTQVGRRVMSGFHACYSLGTLAMALVDAALFRAGVSYEVCSLLASAVILAALPQVRHLPGGRDAAGGPGFALPSRATLVLGACCFIAFLSEGAATDWSAVFLRFSRAMSLAASPLGYAGFAVATTLVRLLGDRLANRFGPVWVLGLGAGLGAAGFGLVVGLPNGWADIAGFFLVGLGTGNVVPLMLSAASRLPSAAHATAAVLALGYAGFLAGPLLIGALADHLGLGFALGLTGVLLAAIIPAARAVYSNGHRG